MFIIIFIKLYKNIHDIMITPNILFKEFTFITLNFIFLGSKYSPIQ
jgi:hypothetical protein